MTPRKKANADTQAAMAHEAGEPTTAADETAAVETAAAEPTTEQADELSQTPEQLIDKMVVFHLEGQRYALPIGSVQEIQQIVAFTDIPSQGGPVVGMVNLRGVVIPALDMRALIGLQREEYRLETPMVICRIGGQLIALIVDEVEDVMELPAGCLQSPPRMHALGAKMIGVCRLGSELVSLLDVEKLIEPVDLAV